MPPTVEDDYVAPRSLQVLYIEPGLLHPLRVPYETRGHRVPLIAPVGEEVDRLQLAIIRAEQST